LFHEVEFFPFKCAVKIDLPVGIMVVEGNDIRPAVQRQPEVANLFVSEEDLHFLS